MFTIPESIQVGPFVLPLPFLLLVMTALLSTYFIYRKCQHKDLTYKQWFDIVTSGIVAYLLVWKLSALLWDPMMLVRDPWMVLVQDGGVAGKIGGGVIGLYVLHLSTKKEKVSFLLTLDLFAYWLLITYTLYALLLPNYGYPTSLPWGVHFEGSQYAYHPVHWYSFIVGGLLLTYLHRQQSTFGTGEYTSYVLLLSGLGSLFISNFTFQSAFLLGLSMQQWMFMSMVLFGVGFRLAIKKGS
ncbi:prolipoprotein diacylglyceryl transferase family protein [Caldalkalibacillus mannanilyticus]|uniref:prolipoprotein diacylglyceryl transferase family protein n=1 Tax=Caldalkalibacillus mannanilyticus TaxID=1418 RepID=UPI0004693542|nr:prolipoprotein diacylglyceryl transferase family protein [Caldalkalibacillus mannanilyticus]